MTEPDDAGQASVLIIGLVVIAAALVLVVANVSRVFLWDRSLAAAADGAAVAAAGSLEPARAGRGVPGAADTVALSPALARAEVARYVADSALTERFGRALAYSVSVAQGIVTVTLSTKVSLTIVGALAGGYSDGVPVSATASARSVLLP
jgi:hypothetical protein